MKPIDSTDQPNDENLIRDKIKSAIKQSEDAIPNEKKRPTDAQISFAVRLGFDPVGLTRTEVSRLLDETSSDRRPERHIPESRRLYLAKLLADSSLNIKTLNDQEVASLIRQRHDQLIAEYPVGSSISIETRSGKTVSGVITIYVEVEEFKKVFSMRGVSGTFSLQQLLTAKRLHNYQDPSLVEKQELRTRVKKHVEDYFRTTDIVVDFSFAVPKTVNALMKGWKKKEGVPTDEEIKDAIEAQKGVTY